MKMVCVLSILICILLPPFPTEDIMYFNLHFLILNDKTKKHLVV